MRWDEREARSRKRSLERELGGGGGWVDGGGSGSERQREVVSRESERACVYLYVCGDKTDRFPTDPYY